MQHTEKENEQSVEDRVVDTYRRFRDQPFIRAPVES